jgi:hypothetical protein
MLIPESWTTTDPYDWSNIYVAEGESQARGLEFFLQKKFSNNWHGTISYSLSESKFVNPMDTTRMLPSDYDYQHVFTALGTYKIEFRKFGWYQNLPGWFKHTIGAILFSDEADIGVRFRYMGGRPYTPAEWNPVTRYWEYTNELLNSARYPDYHRLDIRWDHKFVFKNWSLSWYLEVENVYNRKNVWFYIYENDGTIETINQFKIFPVGGLVIEF